MGDIDTHVETANMSISFEVIEQQDRFSFFSSKFRNLILKRNKLV